MKETSEESQRVMVAMLCTYLTTSVQTEYFGWEVGEYRHTIVNLTMYNIFLLELKKCWPPALPFRRQNTSPGCKDKRCPSHSAMTSKIMYNRVKREGFFQAMVISMIISNAPSKS